MILRAGAETPVLSRDQVPFKSEAGGFRLGDSFSSVALSPARNQLAFSLRGTHDWAGVLDLRTREIRELTFWYGGTVEKLIWSPDNQHLVVQGLPARGRRSAQIVSTLNGEVLAIDELPFPWGDADIYDARWSVDGTKIFFTATPITDPTTQNRGEKTSWVVKYLGLACNE